MAKVILDAGHGGNDAGDIYMERSEKDDNLKLTLAIGDILQNVYGVDVAYTRTADNYLSQLERVKIANSEGGDFLLSIHRVIGDIPDLTYGLGFYIYSQGGLAQTTAENIAAELATEGYTNYLTTIRTDLPIFRNTTMPTLMMGVGYLNSEEDNMHFDARLNEIAAAIAKGVVESISEQSQTAPPPVNAVNLNWSNNNNANILCYRVQVGAFSIYENAINLQAELIYRGYPAIIRSRLGFYAVQVGDYAYLDDAVMVEQCLRLEGYDTLLLSD